MKYISKILASIFTVAILAGCAESFELPDNDDNNDKVENNDNDNSGNDSNDSNDSNKNEIQPLAPTNMADTVILYKSSDWRQISTSYTFEYKSNTIESGDGQIILNEVITNLPEYAFGNRDNLAGITLPPAITSIGENAFYDCDVLTQVSLSPNLVYIEPYAFASCNALKTITFPATLKTIYFAVTSPELETVSLITFSTVSTATGAFSGGRCKFKV